MAFRMEQLTSLSKDMFDKVVLFGNCVISDKSHTFSQCYATHDAITSGYAFAVVLAVYSFVWSIIGQNCSKVDQIWSIAPVLFTWHFFHHHSLTHPGETHFRLLLLACLVTAWGVRLTFNFWRKGGYGNLITHEEDYRWPIIRRKVPAVLFLLFNLTFIATYQNLLLFWIAVPAYVVSQGSGQIETIDALVAALFVFLLLAESVADEQHFQFQTKKHALKASERSAHPDLDVRRGFFSQGLFAYSRHPNYFSEQMIWVTVYLFSLTTSEDKWNWTICGCLQLILLFQGSMNFGESITVSKYPEYVQYQATTSQCVPLPWTSAYSKEVRNSNRTAVEGGKKGR